MADFRSSAGRFSFSATTTTGFEYAVQHELQHCGLDDLHIDEENTKCSGRLLFSVAASDKALQVLKSMLSVKRFYAIAGSVELCPESNDMPTEGVQAVHFSASMLQQLEALPTVAGDQWRSALHLWRQWQISRGSTPSDTPSFRVTCQRGGKHSFTTEQAAQAAAIGIQQVQPSWTACLVDFELEVVVHVHFNTASLALSLTPGGRQRFQHSDHDPESSVMQRARGATTLQTDICYGLLVAASIQSCSMMVDPMCGTNSIAETALRIGVRFCLVGDYAPVAIEKTVHNAKLLPRHLQLRLDVVRWDCRRLPLRDHVVEALVTDMPFGKRISSEDRVNMMYPAVLSEFLRVSQMRRGQPCGVVVLLTMAAKLVRRELRRVTSLNVKNHWGEEVGKGWANNRMHSVNHGGLDCYVFVLNPRRAVVRADLSNGRQKKEDVQTPPGSIIRADLSNGRQKKEEVQTALASSRQQRLDRTSRQCTCLPIARLMTIFQSGCICFH